MNSEIAKSLKADRKRIERELKHNTRMLKLAGFEVGTRKRRKTKTKTKAKAAAKSAAPAKTKAKAKANGKTATQLSLPPAPVMSKRERAEQLAAAD